LRCLGSLDNSFKFFLLVGIQGNCADWTSHAKNITPFAVMYSYLTLSTLGPSLRAS
jgi:hypothetical protein